MPRQRSDFNFWNLDWLELRGKPNTQGQILPIPYKNSYSIKQAAILHSGKIIILKPNEHIIQTIESNYKDVTTAYKWEKNENLIDVADFGYDFYLLAITKLLSRKDCREHPIFSIKQLYLSAKRPFFQGFYPLDKKQKLGGCISGMLPDCRILAFYFHTLIQQHHFIDMAVVGNKVYVLDLLRKTISELEEENKKDIARFKISASWSLQEYQLSEFSLIAVASYKDERQNVAYVVSVNKGEIVSVVLDRYSEGVNTKTQSLQLNFAKKLSDTKRKIGSEIYLCTDDRNETLIVTDTKNHRILEVNCKTGVAEIICGTGRPEKPKDAESKEGVAASRAGLNTPCAVAIYRPAELISQGLLTKTSREILESDETGVRPRTILISDSGNNRILKLIELPKTHLLFASSGQRKVFTLLGGGEQPIEFVSPSKENLQDYRIKEPVGLTVSVRGELFIWKKSTPMFTLLRPVTAATDLQVFSKARKFNLEDSD
ncbi:MAG: hypothetical protein QNJ55_36785 [Xenococcus sp. MO_188.B8]|nr:hypothetical protein [Xenococcus sp. MO_188.B8]